MNAVTTNNGERIPAPQNNRINHVPSVGDVYIDRSFHEHVIRLTAKKDGRSDHFTADEYNFLTGEWERASALTAETLKEYYTLILCDFNEIASIAAAAVSGDKSGLVVVERETASTDEDLALVSSRPAEQVLALTEKAERLHDKVLSVKAFMRTIIKQKTDEMQQRVRDLEKQISKIGESVDNLHRIITVMNLYTGRGVALEQLASGESAPLDAPIHIRQRILFMDEEYLADAANGGIDYRQLDRFYEWLKEPGNRDTICPEPKCIVALKPKRYDMRYVENPWYNDELNKWNHHTFVVFRNGENLYVLDSEDLELYITALPWSDQQERFDKEAQEIIKRGSSVDALLDRLRRKTETLGYMYTKYMSFLQGVVDEGTVFPIGESRPNISTLEGVVLIHDAENAIGTGRSWKAFQKEINSKVRRGSRVVYHPCAQDERGITLSPGELSRFYWHDGNKPRGPKAGIYSVDYPTKVDWTLNPKTGRTEKAPVKMDKLAFPYAPEDFWRDGQRRHEMWIYSIWAVVNYDLLSVKIIDEFMADRTQRESFRAWMPILQEARKHLVDEERDEGYFKQSLGNDIMQDSSLASFPAECLQDALDEAVSWWKNKVIFTRPLRADDAKAWRMIRKRTIQILESNGK